MYILRCCNPPFQQKNFKGQIISVSGKVRDVVLHYQNRGVLLQRCAVMVIVYSTVVLGFFVSEFNPSIT